MTKRTSIDKRDIGINFEIRCLACAIDTVEVRFSAGDGFCPSPAVGFLEFYCPCCDEVKEVEDD